MKKIPTFPEPSDFDERVRKPGQAFLSSLDGTPLSHDFRGHSYWSRAHNQLHRLYAGICAYSSAWTPLPLPVNADNGHSSVDHFMPKTESPNVAYEWSNFRLARAYVNQAKGNSTDISDPTSVCDEWFQINFKTFLGNEKSRGLDLWRHAGTLVRKYLA